MCECVCICMHRYTCTLIEGQQKYPRNYNFCMGLYKKKDELKKKKKGRMKNIFPYLWFNMSKLAIVVKLGNAIVKTQHSP